MYGLATKAEAEGRAHRDRRQGHGLRVRLNSGAVTALVTDKGKIACDDVIVGVGPWVKHIWDMLELPKRITIKGRDGKIHDGRADVDLLVPPGGHARRRSEDAEDQ